MRVVKIRVTKGILTRFKNRLNLNQDYWKCSYEGC